VELEAQIRSGPFGPKTAAVFGVDGTLIGDSSRRMAELRHEAWWLVKAHQRAGHLVVLASTAAESEVAPLAGELGVEHVVSGREQLRDLLDEHGVDLRDTHVYGHGVEDVPLLSAVGHPHPVDPLPELATLAGRRGWPVLRLRSTRPEPLDPRPALRTVGVFGSLFTAAGLGAAAGVLYGDRRRGIDLTTTVFDAVAGPLSGVRIEVVGQEHAWAQRPAVFFINHQSALVDFLVTARIIRSGYTAVAKAEVKSMPVVGPMFDLAGVAFLQRTDRAKAIEALQPAVQTLRAGTSVIIAPEGTRSASPKLGRFKKGGFHLAMQAGVPIVPIVIRNAGEIMWRDARTIRAGTIHAAVLPPVATDGWRVEDLDGKVAEMVDLYNHTLENWPAPTADRS
jgi:putative phosphoserine phosphatase/1-acylglycerol-3-phosphate O-acyltransferase